MKIALKNATKPKSGVKTWRKKSIKKKNRDFWVEKADIFIFCICAKNPSKRKAAPVCLFVCLFFFFFPVLPNRLR
jgi:hypothetical protein